MHKALCTKLWGYNSDWKKPWFLLLWRLYVGEDRRLSQNYRYKCKMTTSDTRYATNPAEAKTRRASRLLHQVKSGWVCESIQAKGIAYVKTLCQEGEHLRTLKVIK